MESIDLKKAETEFLKYTEKYDLTNPNIERKQQHSLRVMQLCEEIAKRENLEEEEIQISKMIGLLHDIARFRQYTEYKTFKDAESFDHGDVGVETLENDSFIRTFMQEEKYDEIIKKAIKNHNKYEIEEGLTEKEEKYAKIIRDADKLDIFWEAIELFWKGEEEEIENSEISKDIQEKFSQKRTINRKEIKSKDAINRVIVIIAFIFDINYNASLKIIEENKYIDRIINRFSFKNSETRRVMEEIRQFANAYIKNKG